jgi:hypothetical protein
MQHPDMNEKERAPIRIQDTNRAYAESAVKRIHLPWLVFEKGDWVMKTTAQQIDEWLLRNRRKIIHCPYQPGNLRITIQGCKRRKLQAERMDFTDISKGDYFNYAYKTGLLRCRDCRIAGTSPRRASRRNTCRDVHAAA